MTKTVKISLMDVEDLAKAIETVCDIREAAGQHLAGCFASGVEVILIFQDIPCYRAVTYP